MPAQTMLAASAHDTQQHEEQQAGDSVAAGVSNSLRKKPATSKLKPQQLQPLHTARAK